MKTSVFCAVSLDGFIARADDSIDWLKPFEGDPHGYEEFVATVDAILIGRRTYDVVMGFDTWFYTKPVFVLSRTLKSLALPKDAVCELIAGEPHEVLDQMKQRGFRHIYVDGGIVIQQFLRAGLLDTLTVTHIPIVLGQGIPLFGSLHREIHLHHVQTRTFPSGMVQSSYEVEK